MVVLLNLCENCGEKYQIKSDEDRFCPFCGAGIEIPKGLVGGTAEGVSKDEYDALYKKYTAESKKNKKLSSKVDSLNDKINELNTELDRLNKKCEELNRKSAQSADPSKILLDTEGKTNAEVFIQFISMPNKKGVVLPDSFKRTFLNLTGNYILDGAVGVDTEVYLCTEGAEDKTEIYPGSYIMVASLRYQYDKLYDYVNADGSRIVSVEPCMVASSSTGYYRLISKGRIVFE